MKALVIGLAIALGTAPAMAATPASLSAVDSRLQACLAKTGNTLGIQVCLEPALSAANKQLNNTYATWVAGLKHPAAGDEKDDAEILKRLVAAERAWITFRDANCTLVSTSMLGGTGESNAFTQCVYDTTKARVSELEAIKASR